MDRRNVFRWACLSSCFLYLLYSFFNVTSQVTTASFLMYVIASGGDGLKSAARRNAPAKARSIRGTGVRPGLQPRGRAYYPAPARPRREPGPQTS